MFHLELFHFQQINYIQSKKKHIKSLQEEISYSKIDDDLKDQNIQQKKRIIDLNQNFR